MQVSALKLYLNFHIVADTELFRLIEFLSGLSFPVSYI